MNEKIERKIVSYLIKIFIKTVTITQLLNKYLIQTLFWLTLIFSPFFITAIIVVEVGIFLTKDITLFIAGNSFLVENRILIASLISMLLMELLFISLYFYKKNENKVICLPDLREIKN